MSFIVYFVLGYLFYAALLCGIGSLANNLKEAQTLMMPIQLLLIVPLVVMVPIGRDPNGLLAQVLSWFPPFTPFVMMNRAAFPPGWITYVGTTLLMLISIFLALRAAARVFETGVLMTGKAPRLRHVFTSAAETNAMSQADNRTIALADRFEFVERMKRSQRLPPRGQFRVIAADVRGPVSHVEQVSTHAVLLEPAGHAALSGVDRRALHVARRRQARSVQRRGTDAGRLRTDRRRVRFNSAWSSISTTDATAPRRLRPNAAATSPTSSTCWQPRRSTSLRCRRATGSAIRQTRRYPHEWSHSLLEFHEYVLFDTLHRKLLCLMFAFD